MLFTETITISKDLKVLKEKECGYWYLRHKEESGKFVRHYSSGQKGDAKSIRKWVTDNSIDTIVSARIVGGMAMLVATKVVAGRITKTLGELQKAHNHHGGERTGGHTVPVGSPRRKAHVQPWDELAGCGEHCPGLRSGQRDGMRRRWIFGHVFARTRWDC